MAARDSSKANRSRNTCAASERSAKELVQIPPSASPTKVTAVSPIAHISLPEMLLSGLCGSITFQGSAVVTYPTARQTSMRILQNASTTLPASLLFDRYLDVSH